MKRSRIAIFVCFMACSASAAWAQYGLYGSPDMLRLPQSAAAQDSSAPQTYPSTSNPAAQMPPASAYQPVPTYPARPTYPSTAGYSATPTYQVAATAYPQPYSYPVQPTATAAYQPYQPAAQYQYPTPYAYPGTRMAAAGQPAQPLPPPPMAPAPSAGGFDAMPPADPPVQQSGMGNQMPDDQGGCCGDGYGPAAPYRGAVEGYEQAARGTNGCGSWQPAGCCPWYASVSALVMNRSDGRSLWTSYKSLNPQIQGGNVQIPMAWQWGGEIQFGHRFCVNCVPYALEVTYWTTEDLTGCRTTKYAGDVVDTPLDVDFVTFNGTTANNWFNGAIEQDLVRRDEFHNLEINLIREQLACACDSPWDVGWSVGIRYFRFADYLNYSSTLAGGMPSDEAYLSDNITNNLVGVQFGFDAAYNFCNGLQLFIKPKIGIYNNFLDSNFQAALCDGTCAYNQQYSQFYPVHGSKNALAFLTQVDVGAEWQFTRNWSARLGYRVLAATGVGFAEDQFPQYICDIPEIENVAHPSSLVLHGAFLGITCCF